MPYSRSRSRYRSRSEPDWTASQREKVSTAFGGIDEEVREAFFDLQPAKLDAVLGNYGRRYGDSARQYAERIYPRWRSGSVQLSGQTLERLLEIVPPFLSFETKLRLYRTVRDAHRKREEAVVYVSDADDLPNVSAIVERIVERARSQPLPPHVDARLVWLSHGDGLLARRLAAEAELAEGDLTAHNLQRELDEALAIVHQPNLKLHVEHSVELPYGRVIVRFGKPPRRSWFHVFSRR